MLADVVSITCFKQICTKEREVWEYAYVERLRPNFSKKIEKENAVNQRAT